MSWAESWTEIAKQKKAHADRLERNSESGKVGLTDFECELYDERIALLRDSSQKIQEMVDRHNRGEKK